MAAERLRVLLVEDDRDQAQVLQATLEREGLSVTLAYDGAQGLGRAPREHPDVVITDLVMPVLDGLQLIQKLHAARELGAAEALVKPVPPGELAAAARRAWRRAHDQLT